MFIGHSFVPQFSAPGFSPFGQLPGAQLGMMALQQQLMTAMLGLFSSLFSGGVGAGSPMGFGAMSGPGTVPGFGGPKSKRGQGGGNGMNSFLGGPARSFSGPAANASHGARGSAANPRNSRDNKFKTLNVNVQSLPLMSQPEVVRDVRKAASQADLIGWNEISPDRYFKAIKDLGPEWGHYMPKHGKKRIPNPISYRKDEWKMLDNGFKKTHGGLAKTSPNRYITWARLKHKGSGQEIVRLNTHLVSGAFSAKQQSNRKWRQENWGKHMKQLSALVDRFEKQGLKVVIGGDFNRNHYKVLGNQVNYDSGTKQGTRGGATLDYLMSVRDRGLRNLSGGVLRGFASDHDAVWGSYSLTRG